MRSFFNHLFEPNSIILNYGDVLMPNSFKIAIVYNAFLNENEQEAKEVMDALKEYDNTVVLAKADTDFITTIQKENFSLVLNLARKFKDKNIGMSIASICELFETNLIGANTYAFSITNDKDILFKILKHDDVPVLQSLDPKMIKDIIEIYIIKNTNFYMFFNKPLSIKLSEKLVERIKLLCQKSFDSIHCSDYCKFQLYIDPDEKMFVTAINPMPILTKRNNFFKSISLQGIDYTSFINLLVLTAAERYGLELSEKYKQLKTTIGSKIGLHHKKI